MKVKRILNDIGAVSKQAIVGAVIGVATLAVGVGLISNFSSDGTNQRVASVDRGYSYDSTATGASAQDIMAARGYASNRDNALSPIQGGESIAYPNGRQGVSGGAYGAGSGQVAGSGAGYGAQGDMEGYGEGQIEGMGTSKNMSVEVALSEADKAKAQAQREAKIAKGQALGDQARATLRKSNLGDSSFGGSSSSAGASYNFGQPMASNTSGLKDSSKTKLPQGGLSNIDIKGAKSGQLGSMGSKDVKADGQRLSGGRSATGQNYVSLGDLGRASKYSLSAKRNVGSDSALGAQDAAAAFDGSKEAEAIDLDGENLQQAAASTLTDLSDLDTSDFNKGIDDINAKINAYNELAKKARAKFFGMLVLAGAGFVAALAVIMAKVAGPWCFLIAGAICTAMAAAIAAIMWGGDNSYANLIQQMIDMSNANDGIGLPGQGELWGPWALFGIFNGLMALSFAGALAYAGVATILETLSLVVSVVGGLSSIFTGRIPKQVGKGGKK